jgi:hypothetical protein
VSRRRPTDEEALLSAEAGDLFTPRELALAGLIAERAAERAVELLRGETDTGGKAPLVDAATVAAELGISRALVYQHAERLGGVRIGPAGEGKKPRWRFDLETARAAGACYRSGRSQPPTMGLDANAAAGSDAAGEAAPGRRRRRLPNRLPPAGSVLAVRRPALRGAQEPELGGSP